MSWPDEVMESYSRDACRFELIKIAFEQALRDDWAGEPCEIATAVVIHADAILAEMEKEPEKEPKND